MIYRNGKAMKASKNSWRLSKCLIPLSGRSTPTTLSCEPSDWPDAAPPSARPRPVGSTIRRWVSPPPGR